jgi:hypothetical protein
MGGDHVGGVVVYHRLGRQVWSMRCKMYWVLLGKTIYRNSGMGRSFDGSLLAVAAITTDADVCVAKGSLESLHAGRVSRLVLSQVNDIVR